MFYLVKYSNAVFTRKANPHTCSLVIFDKTVLYIGMCLSEVSRIESYRILYLLDPYKVMLTIESFLGLE